MAVRLEFYGMNPADCRYNHLPRGQAEMPIYEYRITGLDCCEHCEHGFDHIQKVTDAQLAACPECGSAVTRVIAAPNLPASSPSISDENVARHGFTRYRKVEKGVYEKTAGKGPEVISDKSVKS